MFQCEPFFASNYDVGGNISKIIRLSFRQRQPLISHATSQNNYDVISIHNACRNIRGMIELMNLVDVTARSLRTAMSIDVWKACYVGRIK